MKSDSWDKIQNMSQQPIYWPNLTSRNVFLELLQDKANMMMMRNKHKIRSNEILGWELYFFKASINWSMLTANLKFRDKKFSLFFLSLQCFTLKIEYLNDSYSRSK
jgi:hypothetical protein